MTSRSRARTPASETVSRQSGKKTSSGPKPPPLGVSVSHGLTSLVVMIRMAYASTAFHISTSIFRHRLTYMFSKLSSARPEGLACSLTHCQGASAAGSTQKDTLRHTAALTPRLPIPALPHRHHILPNICGPSEDPSSAYQRLSLPGTTFTPPRPALLPTRLPGLGVGVTPSRKPPSPFPRPTERLRALLQCPLNEAHQQDCPCFSVWPPPRCP